MRRLERQGERSPESSMIRSYLDWLLAVPWSKRSEERLDPEHTREVLDEDHAGLEDVKRRITEFIAVRKLRQERGIEESAPTARSSPWWARRALARRRSASPWPAPWGASSCACRWAASTTRPRFAVTGAPTSAPCRGGSFARCATPGR